MIIPFAIPGGHVESTVEEEPDRLVIRGQRREAGSRCPECGCLSRSVHSRYCRHPADLLIATSRTSLHIEVRRFCCSTPSCHRRTFAEPWPDTKGALSPTTARLMVFKLVMAAAKTWRRLKGENLLPKIVAGVTFKDGTEVTAIPAGRAA